MNDNDNQNTIDDLTTHTTNPTTSADESVSDVNQKDQGDTNREDATNMDEESTNAFDVADNSGFVKDNSPSVIGEQSVSGTSPDLSSDDDTLANAQAIGTQLGEDSENPQELDIARDIDKAEEDKADSNG